MTAMKPSGSVLRSAVVCGDGVRTAASARAAGPRRWVRARGGCAVRGVGPRLGEALAAVEADLRGVVRAERPVHELDGGRGADNHGAAHRGARLLGG